MTPITEAQALAEHPFPDGRYAALFFTAMNRQFQEIKLPADFRRNDFLDFHRRDAHMLAEHVGKDLLKKGITWRNRPACLTIRFKEHFAESQLDVDGLPSGSGCDECGRIARRMLGLEQKIHDFEEQHAGHPLLGGLIARQSGLRVPLSPTPFEALTWAIIGQQISVSAAVSVRRNFIRLAGAPHSEGIWCYPDPERVSRLTEAELRGAGFSLSKARTVIVLSRHIVENRLIFHEIEDEEMADEMRDSLLRITGIGPWTVNYALLRGFGWLDGSLHGDVAVRRGIQALFDLSEKISGEQARFWLADFSPWRALVAAHLWAAQTSKAW